MHIHTYIHTYIHLYIYTHVYVYTYIHAHTHTYVHTYIHTYTHTYVHTCIHTYITYVFIHLHICTCWHICVYTHVCLHACMCVFMYYVSMYVGMYVCMEMHIYIYRYVFAIRHLGSYITLNICLYMTGCFIIFRRYLIHQLPFKWHYIKHQRRICVCACVHIPCFAKLVMRSFGFLESEHAKNIHVHTPGLPHLYFRFSFSDR